MKILLVSSHFYPENFKANDMAFELARRGHDVTVLAPIPDYPIGRFFDGYGIFKRRKEIVNGVKVIRTIVIPRHKGSAFWLMLNYFSHTFFSTFYSFWLTLRKKFDTVIVHETSPILIALPAIIIKKLQKIPLHFWVLDLWPESVAAASNIKSPMIMGMLNRLTKWMYKNSDSILIGSKGYRKSINQKGDFDGKITYFPNWVEQCLEQPSDYDVPDFPEGFNILVAGNMGDAQDLPHVMDAIRLLKGKPINLILIGDGRKQSFVEDYTKEHGLQKQVFCMGRFPLEAMPKLFAKADLLFMALKDEPIFALTVPSRLQAYMSSGKPVAAMINGEGADLIKEADCGWSVPAESSQALADLFLKLSKENPMELSLKGMNGKNYSQSHFHFSDCMNNLETIISK